MEWAGEAPGGAGKQDSLNCEFDYARDKGDELLAGISGFCPLPNSTERTLLQSPPYPSETTNLHG